jgi:Meiotically up-regulated gene 113
MDRDTILQEIRRAAESNGGLAPGRGRFQQLTGITEGMWRGKYWLRWSDAVAAAGLTAGRMNEPYQEEVLLAHLAKLTLAHQRFPTQAEIRMARAEDASFPNDKVFYRFGSKAQCIERLRSWCQDRAGFSDVLDVLPTVRAPTSTPSAVEATGQCGASNGYVYMLKLGKHFKVGKTFAVPRRHRQVALELPEKPEFVHAIHTDDPDGIEGYWHNRFSQKRTNGEWFALEAQDIRAFKRRKFM